MKSKTWAIFVKNAKTEKVSRVFFGRMFDKVEAAKLATSLDMRCKPHLSYFTKEIKSAS